MRAGSKACGSSGTFVTIIGATSTQDLAPMNRWGTGLVALGGLLLVGTQAQGHHAVASVYDLNKEIVLEGQLVKLNFVNPHPSMIVAVPNADGTATEWTLTTASIQNLTAR